MKLTGHDRFRSRALGHLLRLIASATLAVGVASAVWWSDVPPVADASRASGPGHTAASAVPLAERPLADPSEPSSARTESSSTVVPTTVAPPAVSAPPTSATLVPPSSWRPPRTTSPSPPSAVGTLPPTAGRGVAPAKPALLLAPGDPLASTVLVEARGCRRGIASTGSGVVLGQGLIVTNAHVVAGQERVVVWDVDGRLHETTVIAFDPVADLAALAVRGLDAKPLTLAHASEGTAGRIAGHPGGGTLSIAPFVVGATRTAPGTDIYGSPSPPRPVMSGQAPVEHGDSGAPLLLADGSVAGVVFAASSDDLSQAWLIPSEEVSRFLAGVAQGGGHAVGTGGRCLA